MKTLLTFVIALACVSAFAQMPAPVRATQAQVNAGSPDAGYYVTPATLAGSGWTGEAAALHMGLVDSPSRVPDQNSGGGNRTENQFLHCIAKFPMTNVLVGMPNFYGKTETGPGGDAVVAFAIEYPLGKTVTPAYFGGTNAATYMAFDASRTNLTGVATNGSYVVGEVRLGTNAIPAGGQYCIHSFLSNSVAGGAINVNLMLCRLDDWGEFGTSNTNRTLTLGAFGSAGGWRYGYGPLFMAALTTQSTVLLVGGSRERGYGDCADTNFWNRYGQQRLYTQHACCQIGVPGCSSGNILNNGANRLAPAKFAQIVVIGGLPINDIKQDSEDPIKLIPAVAGLFTNVPVYCETAIPKPTSIDGFATIQGQTADHAEDSFNTALLYGQITNLAGAININGPIELYPGSGLYAVDGLTNDVGPEGPFYGRIAAAFGGDPLSSGNSYGSWMQGGSMNRSGAPGYAITTNVMNYANATTVSQGFAVQACPFSLMQFPASPATTTNAWTVWVNTNGMCYLVATNPAGGYLFSKLTGTITTTP